MGTSPFTVLSILCSSYDESYFYDNLDKGSDEMKRMNAIPKVRMGTIRYIHHPDAATKGFNMYVDMMKEKLVQKRLLKQKHHMLNTKGVSI